jgi:hypothetical protein
VLSLEKNILLRLYKEIALIYCQNCSNTYTVWQTENFLAIAAGGTYIYYKSLKVNKRRKDGFD